MVSVENDAEDQVSEWDGLANFVDDKMDDDLAHHLAQVCSSGSEVCWGRGARGCSARQTDCLRLLPQVRTLGYNIED